MTRFARARRALVAGGTALLLAAGAAIARCAA